MQAESFGCNLKDRGRAVAKYSILRQGSVIPIRLNHPVDFHTVVGLCVLNSSIDLLFGDLLAKTRTVHVNAYSSTMACIAPFERRSHRVALTVNVGVETEEEGHFRP